MKEVWYLQDKKTNEIEGIYASQEIAYKYAKYLENKTGRKFWLLKKPVWER